MDPATASAVTAVQLVGSAISGAVEALVGELARRGLDGAGRRFQKLRGEGGTALDRAYAEAIEACSGLVASELALGGGRQQARALKLLRGHAFEREATRLLLFGESPKRQVLLDAYRQLCADDGEAASGVELEGVSRLCHASFTQIQTSLAKQEQVAGLLSKAKADAWDLEIGFEQVQALLAEIARNTASTARTLRQVEGNTRSVAETQRAILTESQRGRPTGLEPTVAESGYLRWLLDQCDDVPLMGEKRALPGEGVTSQPTSLRRVYVSLATTKPASWELVCDRLGLSPEQRTKLDAALRQLGDQQGQPERRPLKGELAAGDADLRLATLARIDNELLKKNGELQSLVKDVRTVRGALEPWSSWEVLAGLKGCVLLGDPGSGKSSFVQRVAALSAATRLGRPEPANQGEEGPYSLAFFPVRIQIRSWGARAVEEGTQDEDLIQRAFEMQGKQVSWEAWRERLRLPGTLVLFDGLDEVRGHEGPREAEDTSLRQRLARAIRDFASTYDQARVVVTCRVRPYERAGRDYYFPKLEKVKLAPLDKARVERFCRRWYQEMRRIVLCSQEGEAERLTSQLLAALSDERRKRLREMAETPLLLTMLAKVNLKYPLPEGRLALYELCVKQLLWEWEILRSGEAGKKESLDQLLDQAPIPQSRENLEKKLWKLAYDVHDSTPDGVADLTGTVLRAAVACLAPPDVSADQQERWDAWARRLVTFLSRRDGLLVYLGDDVFTFPHRTFQEYLAARWMRQDSARRDVLLKMAGREGWDEAVRLACLQLASESRGDGLDLLRHLALDSKSMPTGAEGVRLLLAWGQTALDLKLDEAETLGASDADTKSTILEVLDKRLTRLLQDSTLPAAQRLEAGEILSDLCIRPSDLNKFVPIPNRGLGYSFEIGRYPVTNFEYRKFIEAGGYERDRPWWSEQAKKEIESWRKWPSAPVNWQDPTWNRDTFPVVGVSWYEALAYCAWLEEQQRQDGKLEAGHIVTLPTAAEWEAAAKDPAGGEYPWGDAEASRLNCKESGFGRTTPVHMHPAQTKEPELFDLVGNVWEWTAEPYRGVEGTFALVGGAYYRDIEGNQTAARSRYVPGLRGYDLGFRVVLVPSSRRSSESGILFF